MHRVVCLFLVISENAVLPLLSLLFSWKVAPIPINMYTHGSAVVQGSVYVPYYRVLTCGLQEESNALPTL